MQLLAWNFIEIWKGLVIFKYEVEGLFLYFIMANEGA
jgi:hypothetical protein